MAGEKWLAKRVTEQDEDGRTYQEVQVTWRPAVFDVRRLGDGSHRETPVGEGIDLAMHYIGCRLSAEDYDERRREGLCDEECVD